MVEPGAGYVVGQSFEDRRGIDEVEDCLEQLLQGFGVDDIHTDVDVAEGVAETESGIGAHAAPPSVAISAEGVRVPRRFWSSITPRTPSVIRTESSAGTRAGGLDHLGLLDLTTGALD